MPSAVENARSVGLGPLEAGVDKPLEKECDRSDLNASRRKTYVIRVEWPEEYVEFRFDSWDDRQLFVKTFDGMNPYVTWEYAGGCEKKMLRIPKDGFC